MKRTAWYFFLGLCCLVGCAVLFIGGSVFFSSYELQRLIQEETAYPTPEEAFFTVHSSAHNVEIERSSASGLFGFWYVGGWEAEKDGRRRRVGTDNGWIYVPEHVRSLLMGAGLTLKSFLASPEHEVPR